MHPKIDPHQNLPLKTITGPIDNWESDDGAAVFTLVISQVGNGKVATAIGRSEVYTPQSDGGPKQWSAEVTVLGGTFHKGGATVFAWASIAQPDGGWEMYPWGRPVDLA
jgi:hypothetical protein